MHPFILFGIIAIAAATISTIINSITSRRRQLENLKSSFGKSPEGEAGLQLESIARYAQYIQKYSPSQQRVDQITWNDLDMDKVFARINTCQTSVGEEYLYNNLHHLPLNGETLTKRENLIQFFASNPDTRLKVQHLLVSRVGKEDYNGLTALMSATGIIGLKHKHIFTILALLPLLMSAVTIINLPIGIIGVILSFAINMIVHYRMKNRVEIEIPSIKYLTSILKCCKSLLKIKEMNHLPIMGEISRLHKMLKSIQRKIPTMSSMAGDILGSSFEYINILFLNDIRHYNKFMGIIKERSEEFRALYQALGEIDLSIAVLGFRLSLDAYSLPEFYNEQPLIFEEIAHPLIPNPVTNTGTIKNDSLLTGSNASGKSTFIRALAINSILAQTINTCAAKSFRTRFSLILTSMVVRDDISAGDSYFIVEIKSLKRVLDMVKKYPCTCFIDEILRGTNTIERIAASASVLAYLHKQDALCIAASHDIELTYILKNQYDNYHFREQVTGDGIVFDYKLKDGPSTTRNAIKLLSFMDFPEDIISQAEELAEEYAVYSGDRFSHFCQKRLSRKGQGNESDN